MPRNLLNNASQSGRLIRPRLAGFEVTADTADSGASALPFPRRCR